MQPPPPQQLPGSVVGRGSFSTVTLAVVDSTLVAAKSSPASNSSLLLREAAVLEDLQGCDQIVSLLGHGAAAAGGDHLHTLFLEYVPGGSLADLIRRGPLAQSAVRRYAASILRGLSHVHRRGYVHCDVKPQNILVCGDGEVKIADFGLAKRKGEKTGQYSVRGTPLYMAPESVARGQQEAPADVWAVGCVVAEMATGRHPWLPSGEGDVWGLMMRIGFSGEEPEIPAGMSEEGRDFLRRCLAVEPAERWTAETLLKHPFVAQGAEGGEFGGAGFGDKQGMSPRSVFDFSQCDDDDRSSSLYSTPEYVPGVDDRMAELSRGKTPEQWGCDSGDGWIRVRGDGQGKQNMRRRLDFSQCGSSSSCSSVGVSASGEERIAALTTTQWPEWWCSSPSMEGWIRVRGKETEEVEGFVRRLKCENDDSCSHSNLKECKH